MAVNLAPAFFTTVFVDGNQMRELVEHLPAGTPVDSGILVNGGALQIATLLNVQLGAQVARRSSSVPLRSSASCWRSCWGGSWRAPHSSR